MELPFEMQRSTPDGPGSPTVDGMAWDRGEDRVGISRGRYMLQRFGASWQTPVRLQLRQCPVRLDSKCDLRHRPPCAIYCYNARARGS